MIHPERALNQSTYQSCANIPFYLSLTRGKKNSSPKWVSVTVAIFTIVLHAGILTLLLKTESQASATEPMEPIQVSLIKAEENISNAPLLEKKKVEHKVTLRVKPVVKKKIPMLDAPLIITEIVSQTAEEVSEEDIEIVKPMEMSESKEKSDIESDVPVYETPKFGVSYLNNPSPIYPVEAKLSQQQGLVLLKVLVKESGKPEKIEISKSSGFKSLDNAAVSAVKKWVFIPAKIGAATVSATVIVPIRFNLDKG